MTKLAAARLLALAVPFALLAGAYGSQYLGGLHPCEMCYWQRWPHFAAIALALVAYAVKGRVASSRLFVRLAALAIMVSGAIGVYHAGVEKGVFQGFTQCSMPPVGGSASAIIADIMARPMIRCDDVQFAFLGISMAGWNAILSLGFGLLILWLSIKPRHQR